jgi:hypothetical protein
VGSCAGCDGCWAAGNTRAPPTAWARYINASNASLPGSDIGPWLAPTFPPTIFDINVVQSNASYQSEGLREFAAQGLPITMIELGNELYDPKQNQGRWPDGAGYAAAMLPYIAELGQAFPAAQLAVVGRGFGGAENDAWNRAVLGGTAAHAATIHFYTPLSVPAVLQASDAPAVLAAAFTAAAQQRAHANATIPHHVRIWVTEFGHSGIMSDGDHWGLPQLDGTWLEGIYSAAALLLLLRDTRVDVALPYCLACADPNAPAFTKGPHGLPPPISDGGAWRLTARGSVQRDIMTTANYAAHPIGMGPGGCTACIAGQACAGGCSVVIGQEMTGDLIGEASALHGTTNSTRDASCSAQCQASPECQFWQRNDRGCWLKKNFRGLKTNRAMRGSFTRAVTMRRLRFCVSPEPYPTCEGVSDVPLPSAPNSTGLGVNMSAFIGWAFVRPGPFNLPNMTIVQMATTAAVLINLGSNATMLDLSSAFPGRAANDNWRITMTYPVRPSALVRNTSAPGALRREVAVMETSRILQVPAYAVVMLINVPGASAEARLKADDERAAATDFTDPRESITLPADLPAWLPTAPGLVIAAVIMLLCASAMAQAYYRLQTRLSALEQQACDEGIETCAATNGRTGKTLSLSRRRKPSGSSSDAVSALSVAPPINAWDVRYECAYQTIFKYAATRTVEDKFQKEMTSVLDFGAIPDGATDCTAFIQHAIDFCTQLEDGEMSSARPLIVPPGVYVCGQLSWVGDLHIKGMGGVIKMNPNCGSVFGKAPYCWINGTPVSPSTGKVLFEDVRFDGSTTPQTLAILPGYTDGHYISNDPTESWDAGFMVQANYFDRVEFRNCDFVNFARGVLTNACSTAIMRGCTSNCVASHGQVLFGPERCGRVEFCNNVCVCMDYPTIFVETGKVGGAASVILPRGSNDIIISNNNLFGHQARRCHSV